MLQAFLSANRDAIIARTRSNIVARLAPRATEAELENGIPLFLDQLIDSLGLSPASPEAIDESAARHGGNLLKRGFTLAQVIHDYGGVCQAITELADEAREPVAVDELQILNRCLDDAMAQAVTEYTRQREQAINSERSERLRELAHELRNALGSAMISFDILKKGTVGASGSTATVFDRSLRRLAALVDSSLARVRLDAGIRAPERVLMREFVEEVEVDASIQANARNCTLSVTRIEPGVYVEVDRQLLTAAVVNLLQNAFRFSRPKGRVSLRTSSTERRVLIEVEDECGGLPPGKADFFTRHFEQGGADRTGPGPGLGLSISRRSVEAIGGTIRVRDIAGIGCVFSIDLPRFSPPA